MATHHDSFVTVIVHQDTSTDLILALRGHRVQVLSLVPRWDEILPVHLNRPHFSGVHTLHDALLREAVDMSEMKTGWNSRPTQC